MVATLWKMSKNLTLLEISAIKNLAIERDKYHNPSDCLKVR
uniref:Uncharacterized protein n=1 Tax=Arundo donax TaxID=35708 RepID=A0A0A9CAW6_ARUDO